MTSDNGRAAEEFKAVFHDALGGGSTRRVLQRLGLSEDHRFYDHVEAGRLNPVRESADPKVQAALAAGIPEQHAETVARRIDGQTQREMVQDAKKLGQELGILPKPQRLVDPTQARDTNGRKLYFNDHDRLKDELAREFFPITNRVPDRAYRQAEWEAIGGVGPAPAPAPDPRRSQIRPVVPVYDNDNN